MRTPAQIEASKRNGAKSHGPVTQQGRERSSRNALKHGLTARSITIDGESEDEWESFRQGFFDRFQPRDFVEERIVNEMAVMQWRAERSWSLQAATVNEEIPTQLRETGQRFEIFDAALVHASAFNNRKQDIHNLGQQETRLSRSLDRALRRLNDIRAKYPLPEPKNTIFENEPGNPGSQE